MSLAHLLWVFLISALPIVELRGALPVALLVYEIPWYFALPVCLLGNLLPVPFLLLFLDPLSKLLSRVELFKRVLDWIFRRTRKRGRIVDRYKRIGLMLFVAIPLPVTGAWTGSIAASLFGISFKHAFLSILSGVLISGVIVTTLSLLGWIGAVIAGIALVILAILGLWRI